MAIITPILNFANTCSHMHSFLGLTPWYQYLPKSNLAGQCTVQFTFPEDIGKVGLALVQVLLEIAAMVAVGFVIYGGFRYILSQGEPEQANAARSTIVNALIGLVIAVSATVIISFVFSSLARY